MKIPKNASGWPPGHELGPCTLNLGFILKKGGGGGVGCVGWLEAWGKGFGVGRCGWVLHGPKIQFGVLDDIKRTFDRDLHV